MMDLQEAALATDGTAVGGKPSFLSVSTDSRAIQSGQLFVALRGAHFDGHEFISVVAGKGAVAAMVDRAWAASNHVPLPLLVVDDTRIGLGKLAAGWRSRFELPLIGVTGSNGKTTVKEMCAAILRAHARLEGFDPDLAVLATRGNLNNDIGMPLMLLRMSGNHRAAVIEMGMNHPGEIGYLTRLAQPTVALVNNAQRAHLLGMGSVQEVAVEKGAIYEGLSADGVAVINADDPFAAYWKSLNAGRRVLSFGLSSVADVTARCTGHGFASDVCLQTPSGEATFRLQVPGLHNVRNALAAAAACLAAGVSLRAIEEGMAGYAGTAGRLHLRTGAQGATVIDDTYNANPDSMRAGIAVLAATPGRKILVIGDMGEIGEQSFQYHDEIGGYAKSEGVDFLFGLGEMSEVAARNFGEGGRHFTRVDDLVAAVKAELTENTVVLVKGSRFMKMERVVDAIAEKV
ncbi:UDP-N-acetylmuramoyl-tripeptide--D-alanyl-D-alanine ligase [Zoogloea sp.]|uniref:UDP-N-acetylmuramoyl-tripeptide--D-alanyl-D- alanine ligase n=1 Tax=Zoogloea sp. TaxID=49181 RepID=UPI00260AECF5|nr:UDP-N-acetylmuramoyl-tripeptide--D-alanyl-D-alanine ligase [Zoogloea sp.]MDD3353099.1 UDP-N-acetylmuramoyl-tripeptide--D-alanyl-D-alanine ligase [Zoogloea sp.]